MRWVQTAQKPSILVATFENVLAVVQVKSGIATSAKGTEDVLYNVGKMT